MSRQKIYITGHQKPDTDSISAAITYAKYKNHLDNGKNKYIPVKAGELNPETKFVLNKFDIKQPKKIKDAANKKIILVDHNETSQSPKNIEEANIVEVIDHHRIADLETDKPIHFHTEPIGSTSTMIAEKIMEDTDLMTKDLAGLLLSAILSDTVIHRSPTNTKKDEEIAKKLAKTSKLDREEYGKKMFQQKSKLGQKEPREIILGDFKEYNMANKFVGIGQVETVSPEEVIQKQNQLLKEMEKIINEREYDILVLLITDLLNEDSEALVKGEKTSFQKAFDVQEKDNSCFLKGVLSRKKQVVPKLEKTFK